MQILANSSIIYKTAALATATVCSYI